MAGAEGQGLSGGRVNVDFLNGLAGEGVCVTTDMIVVVYRCDEIWSEVGGVVIEFFVFYNGLVGLK